MRGGLPVPDTTEDVQIAAAADVPVLISGEPAPSLELACELCRHGGSGGPAIVLIDCRRRTSMAHISRVIAESTVGVAAGPARALLLLEVHALGPDAQALLEERLETALLHRRNTGFRVIASSSIPLYDQVAAGRFRERLYYLLNMIRLIVPTRAVS